MRVLLDECTPKKLGAHVPGHEVRPVGEMGWAGVKNGRLLQLAEQQLGKSVSRRLDGAVVYITGWWSDVTRCPLENLS